MSSPLATYLHDHLAGSKFAVDLLESLKKQHDGEPLGGLAAGLLIEIEQDRDVLKGLIESVGEGSFDLKEAAGWIAEKVSRLKLQRDSEEGLGTFEALEMLTAGVFGKACLWNALQVVSEFDPRVAGPNFEELAKRADGQRGRLEKFRLEVARRAFRVPTPTA